MTKPESYVLTAEKIAQVKKLFADSAKKHARIKCNCGHYPKDHYQNAGFCHDSTHKNAGQCGCTWYYPNDKWIASQQKKLSNV